MGRVKSGQIATVTLEALASRKLASHVEKIATSATSSSGVVSYDVTFALDQATSGEKPGMSATAEVVIAQAEGLNVPSSAITAGSVIVLRKGKQERHSVTTGLAGGSTTIVTSGLEAGEQVLLPTPAGGSSSATNVLSRLGSKAGGGGALGGGGGFPGGGFAGGGGPPGGAARGGG
ncbi:MAG: efflux RND transporter periplasmic adaptor subunit [Solirubrobacteraceae bacterium]